MAAGSQRSPSVTGRLYPTRPSTPAASSRPAERGRSRPNTGQAHGSSTSEATASRISSSGNGAGGRRPPGWRPARAPTGTPPPAPRPARPVPGPLSRAPVPGRGPAAAVRHAAICCNGLMQFNTYTVAGAHIAVWLVNHPAPGAAALARSCTAYDVHGPAGNHGGGRRAAPMGSSGCAWYSKPAPWPAKRSALTRCWSLPTAAPGWSAMARACRSTSITRRSHRPGREGQGADRGRAGARGRRRSRLPPAGLQTGPAAAPRSSTPRATAAATSAPSAAPTRSTWPTTVSADGTCRRTDLAARSCRGEMKIVHRDRGYMPGSSPKSVGLHFVVERLGTSPMGWAVDGAAATSARTALFFCGYVASGRPLFGWLSALRRRLCSQPGPAL